jgi:hypothetical protein
VQAPRTESGTTPGAQAPRSSNLSKAASLVKEAEAACKAGKNTIAADKAKAAIELMK